MSSNTTVDSTGLSLAQKTSLITAWTLLHDNQEYHAHKIFAEFYELHPEYLRHFEGIGNENLHKHSKKVLETIGKLITEGLHEPQKIDLIMLDIGKVHGTIERDDVKKLNKIIKKYFLNQVRKHKTETLVTSLNLFLETVVESKFMKIKEKCEQSKSFE